MFIFIITINKIINLKSSAREVLVHPKKLRMLKLQKKNKVIKILCYNLYCFKVRCENCKKQKTKLYVIVCMHSVKS